MWRSKLAKLGNSSKAVSPVFIHVLSSHILHRATSAQKGAPFVSGSLGLVEIVLAISAETFLYMSTEGAGVHYFIFAPHQMMLPKRAQPPIPPDLPAVPSDSSLKAYYPTVVLRKSNSNNGYYRCIWAPVARPSSMASPGEIGINVISFENFH